MITLSGGNFGGQTIEWVSFGNLEDGREYMVIENHTYARTDDKAVFVGMI